MRRLAVPARLLGALALLAGVAEPLPALLLAHLLPGPAAAPIDDRGSLLAVPRERSSHSPCVCSAGLRRAVIASLAKSNSREKLECKAVTVWSADLFDASY